MNISIRRAEPSDAAAVQLIYTGPKVIRETLQIPFPSIEQRRQQLAEVAAGVFHLLACVDGEVPGHLCLTTYPHSPRRRHVGAIGLAVRDEWQGKGVGTALMQAVIELADNWLNLSRLELDVFTDNEPALKLYTKCGFVIEGTRVGFAFRVGQLVDTYLMARRRA